MVVERKGRSGGVGPEVCDGGRGGAVILLNSHTRCY